MAFTGKATYSAGTNLPELAEDVSDLIGIVSPYETPLLDALGDPMRAVTSIRHEWLEDELLPNKDTILSLVSLGGKNEGLVVEHKDRFRLRDILQVEGNEELMIVESLDVIDYPAALKVQRGYAGTKPKLIESNSTVNIIGNPSVEGGTKPSGRFTRRNRCSNYTQVFTAMVQVNTNDVIADRLGLAGEIDYQKQERLRELLRNLENMVLNETPDPEALKGSSLYKGTWKRKMRGIIPTLRTNVINANGSDLTEKLITDALKQLWENGNGNVNLIVVGGFQKRKINAFCSRNQAMASVYENDFGICRIITTRWVPQDAVLLLDLSRISVMPLAGRSFHFKPLASSGDYECGELIGEYTLELKNETAHGLVRDLSTS